MNEERFENLMERIKNMKDAELFELLESAGMLIEDVPEGDDPRNLIIATSEEGPTIECNYTLSPRTKITVRQELNPSPREIKPDVSSAETH